MEGDIEKNPNEVIDEQIMIQSPLCLVRLWTVINCSDLSYLEKYKLVNLSGIVDTNSCI